MIKHEDFIIQYPFKEKKWSVENTKFFFLKTTNSENLINSEFVIIY